MLDESGAPEAAGEGKSEDCDGKAHAKVPLQLRRLPLAGLREVSDALAVLKGSGLSDSVNVEELLSVLKSHLPPEGLLSTYMEMCDWARTPHMWAKAAGPPDPSRNFELSAKSADEMKKAIEELEEEWRKAREAARPQEGESELSSRVKKAGHRADRSSIRKLWERRQEERKADGSKYEEDWEAHFASWWASQLEAEEDLQRLADDSSVPKSLGAGPGVLFSELPKAAAAPPPVKPKRRLVQKVEGEAQAVASPSRALCAATLHIGAAGCGIGAALWRRLMQEHQVSADGARAPGAHGLTLPHFDEAPDGRLVPRGVFVSDGMEDLEPARQLGCVAADDIVGQEGFMAATLYDLYMPSDQKARLLYDVSVERLRKQVERMDGLRSLLISHSATEACGAGLTMRVLQHFCTEFPKAVRVAASVMLGPSECESNDVLPLLGVVRCQHALMNNTDFHVYMDHSALQNLCSSRTPCGMGIENPSVADEYSVVASVLAAWTSPFRMGPRVAASEGSLRLDLRKAAQNLVPYPRINTLLASFAPLRPDNSGPSLDGPARLVLDGLRHGRLSSVDMQEGKLISVGVSARGLAHCSLMEAVSKRKAERECQFVDWCPTGFLLGTHSDPSVSKEGEVAYLSNSTAVGGLLKTWIEAFEPRSQEWQKVVWNSNEKRGAVEEDLENLRDRRRDYEEVGAESACEGSEGDDEY